MLQFADEAHPLFQRQRETLMRGLRYAWQRKDPNMIERGREMTEAVRRLREGEGDHP